MKFQFTQVNKNIKILNKSPQWWLGFNAGEIYKFANCSGETRKKLSFF